jgi:hypothetical protein
MILNSMLVNADIDLQPPEEQRFDGRGCVYSPIVSAYVPRKEEFCKFTTGIPWPKWDIEE